MKHVVKYYGMIEEITQKHKETFEFSAPQTVSEFIAHVEKIYPPLTKMSFRVSVDHVIADLNFSISKESEIALLPPFAGG